MPGPLDGYRIVDLTVQRLRAAGHDDARRPGRRRDQGRDRRGGDATRAAANRRGGFSASFLNNNRNKRSIVLDLKTPAGVAGGAAAGRRRRCLRAEFPPRRRRADRRRRGCRPRRGAKDRLRLDQRVSARRGPYAAEAGLRPGDPGAVRAGDDAGRLRSGAAAAGAHHPARQIDRDHRRRRRSPRRCWRASAPARASMSGCRCWTRCSPSCGAPTWAARPSSATSRCRQEAASAIDLIYDTADGYITVAALDRPAMGRADAGARSAGMARGSTLQDAGAAPAEHRRHGCE